jgi:hypothetical protein
MLRCSKRFLFAFVLILKVVYVLFAKNAISTVACKMGKEITAKIKVYSCGYPITSTKLSILSPLSRVSRLKPNRPARLLRLGLVPACVAG